MSLADSVDEGDLSPYDLCDDWEAVEVEQRRRAREDRLARDQLWEAYSLLEMQHYVALEFLKATVELLNVKYERITELEGDLNRAYRDMEYEDWRRDPDDFWARAEQERAGQ